MATSLANLEKLVRHYARDDSLDIDTASSTALMVTNKVYRGLAAAFPWPEFLVTKKAWATTTAYAATVIGQEKYKWIFESQPVSATSIAHAYFTDVKAVEIRETDPILLTMPSTERDWNLAKGASTAIAQPRMYKREYDTANTRDAISLRPLPSTADWSINVTGVKEPTVLTNGSTTEFLTASADDALALLIAADWNTHDMNSELAAVNLQNAQRILQTIWSKEQVTKEVLEKIIGA